ncbi:hypothetical protein RD792_012440 [Penstemon davidsonii]|uniref:Uncharacterized protein n=1 Tax=Penstemon davidsonii TaxID=160366 RepID=A0ABR0CWV4_9LAMI|nr:hypothetical protein RD792_012440 [Penstemon davidsonii]
MAIHWPWVFNEHRVFGSGEFGRGSPGGRDCGLLSVVVADVSDGDGAFDSAAFGEGRCGDGAAFGGALSRGVLSIWAGVLITASDCFMFLLLENYGVRKLEGVFAVLISTMALSFAWMFADAKPSKKELLIGLLVPRLSSRTIRQAVGVVGCIIMPHNVFLHSALVQSRKIDPNKKGFYGSKQADSIGLVNAGQYLEDKYGGGQLLILYIWGVGLLAAGQSSTITGTYAGQFIMGGFLNLPLKKSVRALITRSCAIIPTIIVALVFNKSEASLDMLNEWLNVLQSIQIPFALIPLLALVAKEERVAWMVAALVIFSYFVGSISEVSEPKFPNR